MPFFLGLMEHLAAHGLNCPQPVKNWHGGALGRIAGRPAALVTFLDGMWRRNPSVRCCAAVGDALAKLHRAGASFAGKRVNTMGLETWRAMFEEAQPRADELQPCLGAEIAKELHFLGRNWPSHLPSGIIHADLFPDNVLFIDDEVSGLIDFYFACTDQLGYDVAICLNAWCFEPDGSYNITKGLAFFSAYESIRRLTAGEVEAFLILARGAALRFTLTRLVDWLNVPANALVHPKDPLEYVKKLRLHQQAQSVRELGLLR
jgi:homoserine kinase type II